MEPDDLIGLQGYGNSKNWGEFAQRFVQDLEKLECDARLKRCRFYFRMFIVEALANFRFEPCGDGFCITEPQTGCAWTATLDKSGQWKFTCVREAQD